MTTSPLTRRQFVKGIAAFLALTSVPAAVALPARRLPVVAPQPREHLVYRGLVLNLNKPLLLDLEGVDVSFRECSFYFDLDADGFLGTDKAAIETTGSGSLTFSDCFVSWEKRE